MTAGGGTPGDAARRLAQAAWEAAREKSWDPLRDSLPSSGPIESVNDRRLARQLARDAEQARQAHARAQQQHALAVSRRERLLDRSRRAVPTWTVVGAGAVAAVPLAVAPLEVGAAVAAAAVVRVGVAVRRLRRPPPVPQPPVLQQGPPPPPHPRSAAFPYVRRLAQVRAALQHLVPLVCPAGREAAEDAWTAAAESDVALRWQAARLAAAEPHRGVDPVLLAQLEAGVVAQEGLVQAVADLVTASADPAGSDRLQDVTDRLLGLAAGLREVR
ncbi:MAG TPA: hypothetical protein VM433_08775 [Mycobacteriales bacterium]|nr:hypothetical protein [Mycobacteriales bacterium]